MKAKYWTTMLLLTLGIRQQKSPRENKTSHQSTSKRCYDIHPANSFSNIWDQALRKVRISFIYPTICPPTHPDAHEAIPQHDPGQEKDEGFVTAKEGRYVSAVDLSQSLKVQVVCQNPQQAERRHFSEEHLRC